MENICFPGKANLRHYSLAQTCSVSKKSMRLTRGINFGFLLMFVFMLSFFSSCEEEWDEHYQVTDERVDLKLMEALIRDNNYSKFLELITAYGLDTLISKDQSKTLFIPTNEAFEHLNAEDTTGIMKQLLSYHISPTLFLTNNIIHERLLFTNSGKYVTIFSADDGFFYDSIRIDSTSPLFLDGKYYVLSEVALPQPNIYEYMQLYSPFMKEYVDSKDTLYLDKNMSIPIGYNDEGETVYDSVYTRLNLFEDTYFPVSEEFRKRRATFILFTQEQYDDAISGMATNMGIDVSDIPQKWQNEVFLPDVINNSIYEGSLDYTEFNDTLINIKGDSTFIDPGNIDPESKFNCSNGIVYNYRNFQVPEELYARQLKFEGEEFCDSLGLGRLVWESSQVSVDADVSFNPQVAEVKGASNDYIVTVGFKRNYEEKYSIEFEFDNMFPRDYLFEWRANSRPSGCFKVFVNDVDITATNPLSNEGCFDLLLLRGVVYSPIPGNPPNIPDENQYNSVGFLVENILTEYGTVTVRLEYVNSGGSPNDGFSIDYFAFTPLHK
jgi:hypothetical protein